MATPPATARCCRSPRRRAIACSRRDPDLRNEKGPEVTFRPFILSCEPPAARLRRLGFAALVDVIDDAEGLRFFRRHEIVAVERALHHLDRLAGVLGVELVQAALGLDD